MKSLHESKTKVGDNLLWNRSDVMVSDKKLPTAGEN